VRWVFPEAGFVHESSKTKAERRPPAASNSHDISVAVVASAKDGIGTYQLKASTSMHAPHAAPTNAARPADGVTPAGIAVFHQFSLPV